MADEQYGWLDSDVAERLLRGESLDAVDAGTRARAAKVAEALAALAGPPPSTAAELPGETAALAAFRAVYASGNEEGAAARRHPVAPPVADAGLVRLGRPVKDGRRVCWGRSVRLGLAAAVAAVMIGGVAMAAGTGVLPTPFGDETGPATSVSDAATPPQSVGPPTPGGPKTRGLSSPGATTGTSPGSGSPEEAGDWGTSGRQGFDGDRAGGRSRAWWTAMRSSCREMAGGRGVGAERMRSLEDAAGGSSRVKEFCKGVLGGGEDRAGTGGGDQNGQGENSQDGYPSDHGGRGNGKGHHANQGSDGNDGGDGESHIRPGHNGGDATPSDPPVTQAPDPSTTAEPPTPTDSAPSTPAGQ